MPEPRQLPQRLEAVLEAIYAAFGIGWDDMAGADERDCGLAEEAIWLARVLLEQIPANQRFKDSWPPCSTVKRDAVPGAIVMADTFLFPSRIRNCGRML